MAKSGPRSQRPSPRSRASGTSRQEAPRGRGATGAGRVTPGPVGLCSWGAGPDRPRFGGQSGDCVPRFGRTTEGLCVSLIPADVLELLKERAAAAPPTNGRQAPFEPVANGDHAADHGPRGRFVRGNRAAAGRSCARRGAALRSALLDAVSPATLKRLVKQLG